MMIGAVIDARVAMGGKGRHYIHRVNARIGQHLENCLLYTSYNGHILLNHVDSLLLLHSTLM